MPTPPSPRRPAEAPGPAGAGLPGLRRAVGPGLLLVLVVGDILGAGIYILVGEVAGEAGGALWLPFLLAFGVAAVSAFAWVELVTKYPGSAGSALYVRRAFGSPFVTFLVGTAVAAATLGAASTAARAMGGEYLEAFVDVPAGLAAATALALLGLLNFWGISASARANVVMTVVEVAGLLLVIAVGVAALARGDGDLGRTMELGDLLSAPGALLGATALAFFAFLGFEDSVHVSEEVHDPARSYPRVLFWALGLTGAVYVAVAFLAGAVVDPERLAGSSGPLLEVVEAGSPGVPPRLFSAVALFAVANTALLTMVTASRLLYGMARQGDVPAVLGRVHRGRRTPWVSVVATTGVAAVLAVTGDLGGLARTTVLLLLAVFALVNVSALVLRSDRVEHAHFRAPPAFPALGAAASVVLVLHELSRGGVAVAGRAGALLGAGVLLFWASHRLRGRRRRAP